MGWQKRAFEQRVLRAVELEWLREKGLLTDGLYDGLIYGPSVCGLSVCVCGMWECVCVNE